jgi:signal transduction histidine kinase
MSASGSGTGVGGVPGRSSGRSGALAHARPLVRRNETVLDADMVAAAPPSEEMARIERLRERLAALVALSQPIAEARDLDELFGVLYRAAAGVLDATIFVLGLYDPVGETVHVVKQVISGEELPGGSFPLGAGFTSQAIRTGRARLVRHWSRDEPPVRIRYAADGGSLPESGVTAPLLWGGQALGVLLVQSYRPEAYDADDLAWLEAVAGQAAGAVAGLRQSEAMDSRFRGHVAELEVILESMADALVLLDAQGRIVRLNHAARELLCLGESSVVLGQALDSGGWERWPAGPRAVAAALGPAVEALRRGQTLRDVEAELGSEGRRVLSYSCGPVRDPGGRPAGGVIVFRDVTGRREVERLKDEVLSIASHDLKTPATVIKLRAQLLRRKVTAKTATLEEVGAGLDTVIQQADRIVGLLKLLLDFSRLEAGRFVLERGPVDLAAAVGAVAEEIGATTDRHRLVVRAPGPVMGEWDEWRLREVLMNLLSNAVKYSPEGGTIEVVVEAAAGGATVRVRDQGVGLPAEELAHVFERFYRATGTRRLEGSGLGLYICQAIVAAHGGRIWAESDGPGRGCAFCFCLPPRVGGGASDPTGRASTPAPGEAA